MSGNSETMQLINALADEEHRLRQKEANGTATDDDRARVQELEIELDQLWDFMRQRDALRSAGYDPDQARLRNPDIVEAYWQ